MGLLARIACIKLDIPTASEDNVTNRKSGPHPDSSRERHRCRASNHPRDALPAATQESRNLHFPYVGPSPQSSPQRFVYLTRPRDLAGVGKPNGNGPGSTICDPSQTCCYGGNSVFCIPLDATCCTFVNAGGWCPSGRACQEAANYIPGLASSCIVPYTAPTPIYTTVAPTSYTQPAALTPSPTSTLTLNH